MWRWSALVDLRPTDAHLTDACFWFTIGGVGRFVDVQGCSKAVEYVTIRTFLIQGAGVRARGN